MTRSQKEGRGLTVIVSIMACILTTSSRTYTSVVHLAKVGRHERARPGTYSGNESGKAWASYPSHRNPYDASLLLALISYPSSLPAFLCFQGFHLDYVPYFPSRFQSSLSKTTSCAPFSLHPLPSIRQSHRPSSGVRPIQIPRYRGRPMRKRRQWRIDYLDPAQVRGR